MDVARSTRAGRSSSRSRSRARRASSTPRSPTLRFALRDRDAGGAPIRSVAARRADPDRRAPAPLRRGASRSGWSSCSASRERWGTTLRTLLWTRTTLVVPAVHGRDRRSTLDVPCTYDLEVAAAQLPRRAARTARCRSSSCSAARVFYAGADGRLQTARHLAGTSEAEYRLPVACGARRWTRYFPGSAWLRLAARDASTGSRAYSAQHALPSWDATLDALLRRRGGDRWTRSRAIADAVLYEGYVLWPYRRSALKNQRRWTFGGVYPRGAQRARTPTTACAMRTQCLVEGDDRAVDVRVRFLHVVERQVTRGGEPSTS